MSGARAAPETTVRQTAYPAGYGPAPALPGPDTARRTAHFARVVAWPAGGAPSVLPGFIAELYADRLQHPRWLHVLPNGDLLVAEANNPGGDRDSLLSIDAREARRAAGNRGPSADRVTLLRDTTGDGRPDVRRVLLGPEHGLNRPFGMAYTDGWLYVASTHAVHRFRFRPGRDTVDGSGERVLELPADGYNNHWTRNVAVSPSGDALYVTVGSGTNVDSEGTDARDPRRAAILRARLDGREMRVFASGLRNPNGLAFEPTTGALWTAVNERDGLGDDLPPDYITSVRDGDFFGWPVAYWGPNEDPRHRGQRPGLVARTRRPDYATGAHTATMSIAFYTGGAFPARYRGGAFVSQRGSWDRSELAGYQVLFIPFADGRPAGPPEPFITGFRVGADSRDVFGRPVGLAVLPDGSLLVADDAGDRVWRVRWTGAGGLAQTATPRRLAVAEGFDGPESAQYHPGLDAWFVSNTAGNRATSNTGFISRLRGDGTMDRLRFIAGSANGVTLRGPKGIVLVADTLWVTDIDAVRAFDARDGRPLASADLRPHGALWLNDIARGSDGALYVTDTGVRFDSTGRRIHVGPDRVFRVTTSGQISIAAEGNVLREPNGIAYHPPSASFVLAPIASSTIQRWRPGSEPAALAEGAGRYDGVVVRADGSVLVTSAGDSSVSVLRDGRLIPLIRGLPQPADLGLDERRGRVMVPLRGTANRVELWDVEEPTP